jgi:transglutaminase-like putative cysteine protease
MNCYHLIRATEFVYDGPVSESYNKVRLRPIHDDRQSCVSFRLNTLPASRGSYYKDGYGNWIHLFNILPQHRRLRIEAEPWCSCMRPR